MKTRLLGIALQIMVTAIIISVLLLIFGIGVLVLIRFCTLRRFSRGDSVGDLNGGRDGLNASKGLSPDDLGRLPCYDYVPKGSKEQSSVECAVCLEMFCAGDKCRLLPVCNHSFHSKCVDSWLLKASVCPLCRTTCAEELAGTGAEREGRSASAEVRISVAEDRSPLHVSISE